MKMTRKQRKAKKIGYIEGYLDGYREGLKAGNPFEQLKEACAESARRIADVFEDPDFKEKLLLACEALNKAEEEKKNDL